MAYRCFTSSPVPIWTKRTPWSNVLWLSRWKSITSGCYMHARLWKYGGSQRYSYGRGASINYRYLQHFQKYSSPTHAMCMAYSHKYDGTPHKKFISQIIYIRRYWPGTMCEQGFSPFYLNRVLQKSINTYVTALSHNFRVAWKITFSINGLTPSKRDFVEPWLLTVLRMENWHTWRVESVQRSLKECLGSAN